MLARSGQGGPGTSEVVSWVGRLTSSVRSLLWPDLASDQNREVGIRRTAIASKGLKTQNSKWQGRERWGWEAQWGNKKLRMSV